MGWAWFLGGLIFVVVVVSLYVQMLTSRNRSYVASHRLRRRKFRPEWDRGKPDDPKRRRGIQIRR